MRPGFNRAKHRPISSAGVSSVCPKKRSRPEDKGEHRRRAALQIKATCGMQVDLTRLRHQERNQRRGAAEPVDVSMILDGDQVQSSAV
jgi:hypothetical protein